MASYRIGIGSFNLKDGAVGIGTESTGLGNLKVEGTLKTTDLDVGVSTFTRYSGFEAEQTNIVRDQTLSGEYSTTGDIVVDTDNTLTVGLGSTACIGSVECVSVKHHFSVPVGDTSERNKSSGYTEGTVRFNRDLGTMEFFNGNEWKQFTYVSDIQNSPSSAGRAVLFRGADQAMEFFNIMTLGNTESFGTMEVAHQIAAGSGSKTRGIIAGGYSAPDSNYSQPRIEYITLASQGNGILFGSLNNSTFRNSGGCSSSTRGLFFGGGHPGYYNVIEYVEIGTLGNALDFGDQIDSVAWRRCFSSPTRGFSKGGFPFTSSQGINVVTIASKGDAVEFGKLSQNMMAGDGCSNSVRGIFAGGYAPGSSNNIKTIQYITMASDGDAINFGDLNTGSDSPSAVANQVRAVISGGYVSPVNIKRMEYVTIASTGNAQSFGDLSLGIDRRACGTTDSHGGLGGY